MKDTKFTDEQIIQMILQSGRERNTALQYVFLNWQGSAKAILRSSGAAMFDIKDAIQEAMVTLDNHIRCGKYQHTGSLKNYFIGICKGRLYSNKRSTNRVDWTDETYKMDGVDVQHPEILMLQKEQKTILLNMLEKLDNRCKEIMKMYRLSYSMAEIADQSGLSSANAARQGVFKCRGKLKKMIAENSLFANYFNN